MSEPVDDCDAYDLACYLLGEYQNCRCTLPADDVDLSFARTLEEIRALPESPRR